MKSLGKVSRLHGNALAYLGLTIKHPNGGRRGTLVSIIYISCHKTDEQFMLICKENLYTKSYGYVKLT